MNQLIKSLFLVAPILFTGCVSVRVPHPADHAAHVSRSVHNAVAAQNDRRARDGRTITHSYIGSGNQTVNEVKQRCEAEAANKLRQMSGGDARYSVLDNDIVTINGAIAANCRLAMGR